MSKRNKALRAWVDQLRAALIDAAGAAVCAGLIDTAHQINAIVLDIDRKTCYTDTRQRRQARKDEEVKTMTIYGRSITSDDMANIADYMRDDIREELHTQLAPCSAEQFLRAYLDRDPDFIEILRREFDFEE